MSVKTIENMIDWVEENIEQTPTLEAMARHVGYSSYYCSSKFHEVVGMSFKEYVKHRKLERAVCELLNTDRRILDIAIQYGFSSNEAFTRAFSKVYGSSPNEYRKVAQ
ncbi:AraC family transcriptional regulator [Anaerocolumna sp. AGMB13025]|uniref:helix-turn-helix transcriptional regulator n=1 Tax=Anaerocolumna sp. AGMB13025 TaxID=3039116 RepID=UPI00241CEA22|nr:AraC family transcriptional regulator [Anaerocolumna sp. AGMB13025]WFR57982.1 AraC family transcriptional regulator [Anaerocolumna sp. AGMB13025]